jgi:hypothetical protein
MDQKLISGQEISACMQTNGRTHGQNRQYSMSLTFCERWATPTLTVNSQTEFTFSCRSLCSAGSGTPRDFKKAKMSLIFGLDKHPEKRQYGIVCLFPRLGQTIYILCLPFNLYRFIKTLLNSFSAIFNNNY